MPILNSRPYNVASLVCVAYRHRYIRIRTCVHTYIHTYVHTYIHNYLYSTFIYTNVCDICVTLRLSVCRTCALQALCRTLAGTRRHACRETGRQADKQAREQTDIHIIGAPGLASSAAHMQPGTLQQMGFGGCTARGAALARIFGLGLLPRVWGYVQICGDENHAPPPPHTGPLNLLICLIVLSG